MAFTWLHMGPAGDLWGGTYARPAPVPWYQHPHGMTGHWKRFPATWGPHVHPGNAAQRTRAVFWAFPNVRATQL